MVLPSGVTPLARSSTSSRDECPPETSSAMAGSGSGPCSRVSTATCAAKWLTPYTGFSAASAYPLAAATPTSRAPARPGPAVTAMASTSDSATPASLRARCIVGTIASRCARLATSGTTPPKRACSSTLDATASASSVYPRTMPIPVSSQEVSMPSTRGSAIASHHHRVRVARLVVPAPDPDRREPVLVVEPLRLCVVDGDLQQYRPGTAPVRLGEQRLQQRAADPVALPVLAYRDVLYPRLLAGHAEPRVPDHLALVERAEVVVRVGQFVPDHRGGPALVAEQLRFDRFQLGDVPPAHPLDGDGQGRTALGVPGSTASGRRRYSGTNCSVGALSRTRCAARAASPAAGGYLRSSRTRTPRPSAARGAPAPPALSTPPGPAAGRPAPRP